MMSIVGPIAVYVATVMLVAAGYLTHRKRSGRASRAEWVVIAVWPMTLLIAFFVCIGWLVALVMEEERG